MAVGALNVNQGVRKTVVMVSVACAGLLSACGSVPQQTTSRAELGQLAKRDFLTQQELAAVRVGMSESDVRGLIGPAMLRDASDKSKWVYVLKQGQGPSEEFLKWGVFFKQGKVERLAALEDLPSLELPPSVAEAAATKALLPTEPMPNSKPMLSLGPVPLVTPEPVSAPVVSLPEAAAVSLAAAPVASELPVTPPAPSAEAVTAPFDALDAAGQASELLSQWAAAWSAKDAKQYLSFYATTFEHGQASRKAWEAQRRARLGDRAQIRVKLSDMAVDVQSEQLARVSFKQEYSSDRYRDVGNKVVTLVRVGSGWKIQKEEFAK